MFTVIYNPNGDDSNYTFSDGEVFEKCLNLYHASSANSGIVKVTNELFILALRVHIRQKNIPLDKVKLFYHNPEENFNMYEIKIDKHAKLTEYPKGFCYVWENFLYALL